jgi:hypothetical protein
LRAPRRQRGGLTGVGTTRAPSVRLPVRGISPFPLLLEADTGRFGKMAAGAGASLPRTHPYLPASFPFAKGQEEPCPRARPRGIGFAPSGAVMPPWAPRTRGTPESGRWRSEVAKVGPPHARGSPFPLLRKGKGGWGDRGGSGAATLRSGERSRHTHPCQGRGSGRGPGERGLGGLGVGPGSHLALPDDVRGYYRAAAHPLRPDS